MVTKNISKINFNIGSAGIGSSSGTNIYFNIFVCVFHKIFLKINFNIDRAGSGSGRTNCYCKIKIKITLTQNRTIPCQLLN